MLKILQYSFLFYLQIIDELAYFWCRYEYKCIFCNRMRLRHEYNTKYQMDLKQLKAKREKSKNYK